MSILDQIKYVYFDVNTLRFYNTSAVTAFSGNPFNTLVEVQVHETHPLASGIGLLPENYHLKLIKDSQLYKIAISGSNINIIDSNEDILNPGFLSLSGGKLQGSLELYQDPIDNLDAVTKQYVDGLTDESKSLNYSFTEDASPGVFTDSSTYTAMSTFLFRGTNNMGMPTEMKLVVNADSGAQGQVRLYDVTNTAVIAESSTFNYSVPTILNMGTLSNLSANDTVWELQMKRTSGTGNKKVRLYSFDVEFN